MNTLIALEKHGPWLSISDLAKLTNIDKADLRIELKSLMEAGHVQKAGKKRGTKYALPSAEALTSQDGVDFKAKIREVMQAAKARVSRKELCEEIGTYDAKIRPSLLSMVEDGEICHNHKKKGQLFWLQEHEDAGLIEEEVELEPEPIDPSDIPEEDRPEINDVDELIRIGMDLMVPNIELTITDLKKHFSSCGRHSFTEAEIFRAWKTMYDKGAYPTLKCENKHTICGWYLHFWIDPVIAIAVE